VCFTGLNQQIFVAPFDVRQIMARVRLVLRKWPHEFLLYLEICVELLALVYIIHPCRINILQ